MRAMILALAMAVSTGAAQADVKAYLDDVAHGNLLLGEDLRTEKVWRQAPGRRGRPRGLC